MSTEALPDWERLLAAERHLQALVPGTVLVGRTAAALHAGHRRSHDGDHVLADLRDRFDEVMASLEAAAGWRTERVQRPVVILGLRRRVPTVVRTVPLPLPRFWLALLRHLGDDVDVGMDVPPYA